MSVKLFSVCSGIGGAELGFENANIPFKSVGCSEIDKYAKSIFSYHYPEVYNYGDIKEINPKDIDDFDILIGGFPCQTFSLAGKLGGFEDSRGTIFYDIINILQECKPKYVLLENVKNLLSHDHGNTFKVILNSLVSLGYDVYWDILNSKYFGVPQNRERVYIRCILKDNEKLPLFNNITFDSYSNNINKNYKQLNELGNVYPSNHHNGKVYDVLGVSPTLTCSNANETKVGYKIRNNTKQKYKTANNFDGINISYATNKHKRGHVIKNKSGTLLTRNHWATIDENNIFRKLTPVECERLQGLPDNWTKYGLVDDEIKEISNTQRYHCIGNGFTINVIGYILNNGFNF